MFNFSANLLFLLQRTEYRKCPVLLVLDGDTKRIYQLYNFTKALHLQPGQAYCISVKVNNADQLYLVIESLRPDTKHPRRSTIPNLGPTTAG